MRFTILFGCIVIAKAVNDPFIVENADTLSIVTMFCLAWDLVEAAIKYYKKD